jgi:hypothetical protein
VLVIELLVDKVLEGREFVVTALRSITQFGGPTGFSQTLLEIHDNMYAWTGGIVTQEFSPEEVPENRPFHSEFIRNSFGIHRHLLVCGVSKTQDGVCGV